MSYYKDATLQLTDVLKKDVNREIITLYNDEIEKIFCGIYIINYISKRIELKEYFNSDYFNISFSCLMEAFSLALNNYSRASLLVLRSCLENFLKFIIEVINDPSFEINDRSYSANKSTLDKAIEKHYLGKLKEESISLNSKMDKKYSMLSGLSHSLTEESKNNIIDYFSDLDIINKENIKITLIEILEIINQIFSFCIIICRTNFNQWDSLDLKKIFRMVFGQSKTRSFLSLVKI
ncbi:hypothetical protein [Tissierella sp.]|uniref:hypothetical protein n=1 Tax=Tissierella sp. TaxID=41274 RepID=UPI0028B24498|nr:hypothetical protein [Tissierella sp.]